MLTALTLAGPAMWHGPGPGFGFFPFFLLIPVFWIVVIVVLASVLGRRWRRRAMAGGYGPGFGPHAWGGNARAAESTLAERFAQGDIDEQEYRARLEVLRANRG